MVGKDLYGLEGNALLYSIAAHGMRITFHTCGAESSPREHDDTSMQEINADMNQNVFSIRMS